MFQSSILDFTLQALILVLMLSMPSILVAAFTGLLVSFVQALTQIQEQTLAFAIKLIGVTITIALTAGWLGGEIYNFALQLFTTFPTLVQ